VERSLEGLAGLKLAYLASFSGIEVRVTALADEQAEAQARLAEAERRIRDELTLMVAASDNEGIEDVIGAMLRERGLTLALAESCTGGLMGEMVTRVPGSSDYFLGSVVSYADQPKHEILGVSENILETKGAVSYEAAAAMARGARRTFGSDLALSITGIAGPGGGTPDKPVGLVFIGLAAEGVEAVHKLVLPLGREAVRSISSTLALALLRVYLLGGDFERFGE
jgi:nicotinamide-nucleotide amidase